MKIVRKQSEVHEYACDNDGECVIGLVPTLLMFGKPTPCVFKESGDATKQGCTTWDYYFCDEPYIPNEYGVTND